jgi:opacity protein-like surface antigen
MPAAAQTGFYFGGTIGNTSVETEFDDINLDFDEDDFSWSAFAGIQATEMFGIEASYNDFGNFDVSREFDLTRSDIDAELTGYDVMGVLSLPVGPLRLFGKGGIVFWDARATAQILPPVGPGFELREEDNGNDLAFGGGLEFKLGPTLSLRGEVEWFDIEDTQEVWFASAGFSFRF